MTVHRHHPALGAPWGLRPDVYDDWWRVVGAAPWNRGWSTVALTGAVAEMFSNQGQVVVPQGLESARSIATIEH